MPLLIVSYDTTTLLRRLRLGTGVSARVRNLALRSVLGPSHLWAAVESRMIILPARLQPGHMDHARLLARSTHSAVDYMARETDGENATCEHPWYGASLKKKRRGASTSVPFVVTRSNPNTTGHGTRRRYISRWRNGYVRHLALSRQTRRLEKNCVPIVVTPTRTKNTPRPTIIESVTPKELSPGPSIAKTTFVSICGWSMTARSNLIWNFGEPRWIA